VLSDGSGRFFVLGVDRRFVQDRPRCLVGRRLGGQVATVLDEGVHPEHQGGGDLRGAQHGVLVEGGEQQFVRGAQHRSGFPPGVGGVGDRGNQSRPRGVGQHPLRHGVTEHRTQRGGPVRAQGVRGAGRGGVEHGGGQVLVQSPPQGGGG